MYWRHLLHIAITIPFATQSIGQQTQPTVYDAPIVKKVTVSNAAVVSAHPLASQAGLRMLQHGGNAFDAAIATQLALAVVYPGAGNIGGGGFLVARLQNGHTLTLDFRETAPAAATRNMYLDQNGTAQTSLSQSGHLAVGVPGTIAGIFAALPHARLPFRQLIQPAINYAQKGFRITAAEARNLNNAQAAFRQHNTQQPVFVKDHPWQAGDTLVQPQLAATLKRIQAAGAKGFYEGKTAALIVAEMKRGNGLITADDLKNYRVRTRPALTFNYQGYQVVTMPMPSSGGVLLGQMLTMIKNRPQLQKGYASPEATQLMIEAERRAYADRAHFMGDPDFVKVPVSKLMNPAYLSRRMNDFTPGKAGSSDQTQAGFIESKETTHLSVIDKAGNCVSITTTLNGGYGSHTVVGEAGFLLNNEMDDFSIKAGVPNMYGAVGGDANAIVPGKRMLSSMTPTIVLKNNHPFLVLGTPGGTTIPTSVFQTIVNIINFHMSTSDAVNNPKFHHQWLPDEVDVEHNFPDTTSNALRQMGYKVIPQEKIGRTEVIRVLPNGSIEAVGDSRGDDSAAGY